MVKSDSTNVQLYVTIIQVYNDTLSPNATICITVNSVSGDINSYANGINGSTLQSQLLSAAFMLLALLLVSP